MIQDGAKTQRIAWPDYARGIAIILVVMGHSIESLIFAKILPDFTAWQFIFSWIYSFHMPVFFLMSGIFFLRTAARPPKIFFFDKIRTLVYPYFLWSLIQSFILVAMANYTTGSHSFVNLQDLILNPQAQFWFLYSLFLLDIFFFVLYKARLSTKFFLPIALAIYILVFILTGNLWSVESHFAYLVTQTLTGMIYFSFGILFGTAILSRLPRVQTSVLLVITVATYLMLGVLVAGGAYAPASWAFLLLSILGVVGTVALSILLERAKKAAVIKYLGTKSLPIFLLSMIASSGIRIGMDKFLHLRWSGWIYLVAAILAGILFPLFLDWFFTRISFKYAFVWPQRNQEPKPIRRDSNVQKESYLA